MEFTKILKENRKEKNLSQRQLADKCGTDPGTISKLESGIAVPVCDEALVLMADELGVETGIFKSLYLEACPTHGKSSNSLPADLTKELNEIGKGLMALPKDKKNQTLSTFKLIVKAQQLAS